MAATDPGSPLEWLDLYTIALAAAIGVVYTLSYALYPHVIPASTRPRFLSFCSGASALHDVRAAKGAPAAPVSWPTSSGTPTYNIEIFAAQLAKRWDPWGKQPLCHALLREARSLYVYSHVVVAFMRFSGLLEPFLFSCVIAYMRSQEVPQHFGVKIAAVAALKYLLKVVCECCLSTVMELRCQGPISCGLRLLVLRKVHRLSTTGRARTTSADVQQAMKNALSLGDLLASWNLRSVVTDLAFALYALLSVLSRSGVLALLINMITGTIIGSFCKSMHSSMMMSFETLRAAELSRTEAVNRLLTRFRAMRSYGWVWRAVVPLAEAVMVEREHGRRVSLMGCLFAGSMSFATKLSVPIFYFISVFIRGEGVSFENGLLLFVNTQILGMCMLTLGGCFGKWAEIKTKASWLEEFLRLPEQEDLAMGSGAGFREEAQPAGSAAIAGGTFVHPPGGGDGQERQGEDFKGGEAALWMIAEGRYTGNWVPCCVECFDESSGSYTVTVTPTTDYASAGGASGKSTSDVEPQQLFKITPAIADIHFQPRAGELTLVSGSVGAGKSSLLLALLGELVRVSGDLRTPCSPVAFQPQAPQLLDGTIEQNICLGVPGPPRRGALRRALAASQLMVDMDDPRSTLHAARERTNVGKDGTLLSGGQRARTALARSVYSTLSGVGMALLDDPVAPVDNEVLRAAWDAAVLQAMSSVTRVVAVNAQLLRRLAPSADRLVLLEGGRIVYDGPPEAGLEKARCLSGSSPTSRAVPGPDAAFPPSPRAEAAAEEPEEPEEVPAPGYTAAQGVRTPGVPDGDASGPGAEGAAPRLAELLRNCEPLRTYIEGPPAEGRAPRLSPAQWAELRALLLRLEGGCHRGACAKPGILASLKMISAFFYHPSSWWFLGAALMEIVGSAENSFTLSTAERWQAGTLGLSNASSLAVFTLELFFFTYTTSLAGYATMMGVTGISASLKNASHRTFASLGLPYFWQKREQAETQVRKILGLQMDEMALTGKAPAVILQLSALLLFTLSVEPRMLPLACVGAVLLTASNAPREWVTRHVEPEEREIAARLEVHVLEQFDCITTLRARGCAAALEADLLPRMMAPTYAAYWRLSVDTYCAMLAGMIHALFVVGGKLSVVRMRSWGADASSAMLYDSLMASISNCVFLLSKMHMPLQTATERFRELRGFLDTEFLEDDDAGEDPPAEWPSEGRVLLEDVTFRYLPHAAAALRGVGLEVRPGEKLGIVGRTGAGKSTLVSLLLRLGPLEGIPPCSGGRVLLDGLDVARLKLARLRRAVALVPQEPVIFHMSLKDNLGEEELTVAEAATALVHCGLDARQLTGKDTLEEAMASELTPSGLSVGQQQMLMTARALVRRPKVLVLDECTASLDCSTADQLLNVISTHCADATVLSIAHRLRFVLKCDRILVLGSGGKVLGLDTPSSLMQDGEGYFATCLRHEELQEQSPDERHDRAI